jgi:hypothetical protein
VTHRFGSFPEQHSLGPEVSMFFFSFVLLRIGWCKFQAEVTPNTALPLFGLSCA